MAPSNRAYNSASNRLNPKSVQWNGPLNRSTSTVRLYDQKVSSLAVSFPSHWIRAIFMHCCIFTVQYLAFVHRVCSFIASFIVDCFFRYVKVWSPIQGVENEVFLMVKIPHLLQFGGVVAATCAYTRAIDRSSRAGYRSILVLTSSASTRAGQSERRLPPAPIGMPEW